MADSAHVLLLSTYVSPNFPVVLCEQRSPSCIHSKVSSTPPSTRVQLTGIVAANLAPRMLDGVLDGEAQSLAN